MRLAHVIGRYPAASHAFIRREVDALRGLGLEVETISIRPPLKEDLRSEADRRAAETSFYVIGGGAPRLIGAHLAALARHPLRYLGTLGFALRLGRGPRGWLWQLFYFAEAIVVAARCREREIGHLHSHFADTGTDSVLLASRYLGIGFSLTVHGPTEFTDAGGNRLAEKARRARFVTCVSDFAAAELGKLLEPEERAKVRVVRLGVDVERFSPAGDPAGDGALSVLSLGRLVPRKAQAVLLRAVAALAEDGVPVRLALAGDGPDRDSLDRLAASLGLSDRVRFEGTVSEDEALALYREADAFCLTSLAEGLPVVLMEAMACGLPVVTTPVAGIPELVEDGFSGLLVEPGDPEAAASALKRLSQDSELRGRLGKAGREVVASHYTLERQARELAELFRSELG